MLFLIDESEQAPKGANTVVSLLHAFFNLHGMQEKTVTLQADNCVWQNKNSVIMWYLLWRVITGLHEHIELYYMLPGHTKFSSDAYLNSTIDDSMLQMTCQTLQTV